MLIIIATRQPGVLGSRHLHDTQRMLIEDERVRIVVHYEDVVLLGESHEFLKGLHPCIATCRHVRIVGPHHLHVCEIHTLELIEVGLPSVVFTEVIVDDLCTEDLVHCCISRITRIRDKHLVTGVAESKRDVHDTFLRTNDRLNLRHGVYFHAISTLVEACHSLVELRQSARRLIAVCIGVVSHLTELVNGLLRRRHVGRADGEGDDVLTLGIEFCYFFQFTAEIVFLDTVYS